MCFNVTSMNKTFLSERTLLLLLNFYIVDTFPSILDFMFVFRKKIYSFFLKIRPIKMEFVELKIW